MDTLELNRQILMWFCIFSMPDNSTNLKLKKKLRIILTAALVIIMWLSLISSILFIVRNMKINVADTLCSLLQLPIAFMAIYVWTANFILRQSLINIFSQMQLFHESSNVQYFHLNLNT